MRLIKDDGDLNAYENAFDILSCDYKVGADSLPTYPYFLSISFGGTFNSAEIFHYHTFTVDNAWKLMWANAEMKTKEDK